MDSISCRRMIWAAASLLAWLGGTATYATAQRVAAVFPAATDRLPAYAPAFPYGADAAVAARPAERAITNLHDAIALAYWSNPRLLAQRAQLRATDNRYAAARAVYGPSVSLEANETYRRDRTELIPGIFQPAQGFSSTAALIFNQPLYTSGRNRSAENGALAQVALGRDMLRLQEADTLLSVVSAYVGVRRDTAAVQVAEDNLALLERQYRDNAERFRVRDITATDLQQVETRVAFGRAQLLQARGQLGQSRSVFLQVVGALPGTLDDPLSLPIAAPSLEQAYAVAETYSPVLRAAQSREKISRAGIDAARAEQGPRVDFRGSAAYGPASPYADTLRTTSLLGQAVLTMPLIDSGLRRAQVREAQEANESDWRLIDAALRDTRQAVTGSWNQLTAARASLAHYQEAAVAAQRAYDGALLQEKAGARTTLDVLDLARDLLNVRTNFITAQANEYLARATLLSAIGRLEAPLLISDLASYDPAAHLAKVGRGGDIPGITPVLARIDGLTTHGLNDRPIRDPAGHLTTSGEVPLVTAATAYPMASAAAIPERTDRP